MAAVAMKQIWSSGRTLLFAISSLVFPGMVSGQAIVDVATDFNLDNLVAYYPFNGNADDYSGNGGPDGSLHGPAPVVGANGQIDGAFFFDGQNDFIDFGDSFNEVMIPLSICFWARPASVDPVFRGVFLSDDWGSGYAGFRVVQYLDGLELSYGDGGSQANSTNRRSYAVYGICSQGSWAPFACVVRGPQDMSIYVNSIEVPGSYSGSGDPMNHNSTPARAGVYSVLPPARYFHGDIDELYIFDKALSASEIQEIYGISGVRIVSAHQKIGDGSGGFPAGILQDYHEFGHRLTSIGDIDGDGFPDLAVGAKDDDGGLNCGAVWILFLNPDGTVRDRQKISNLEGNLGGTLQPGDGFCGDLASLGDLDRDGTNDLAVGVVGRDIAGLECGSVWVLFLNPDGTVKRHQEISNGLAGFPVLLDHGDTFGHDMAAIGDLDGDGTIDLAVGAHRDDDGGTDHGAVWVLFLGSDGTVDRYQKISDTEGSFTATFTTENIFGTSLAPLGDLDGDGVLDLAVGAVHSNDIDSIHGAMYILFLNSDGTVKHYQKISDTEGGFSGILDLGDRFGNASISPGDLDGDLIADLVVGSQHDDDGGTDRGCLWVLYLNPDGTVKSHGKISNISGGFAGALADSVKFGCSVTSLGDLNGDGMADLAVGAFGDDEIGGHDKGAAWVLFLETAPLDGDCNLNGIRDDIDIAGHPGWDWNGDGILDVCQDGQGLSEVPGRGGTSIRLYDPFPNPFNPQTAIAFELPEQRAVTMRVFDLAGRLVRVLLDREVFPNGRHEAVWNGRDDAGRQCASGTYFFRLEAGNDHETKRMVLVN